MSAAIGTACTGKPDMGRTPINDIAPHTSQLPFPAAHHRASEPVRLKDASGAAARPGPGPVLDPPSPLATNKAATGEQERLVQHAPHPDRTPQTHPLTRHHSFRDERH